MEMMDFAIKLFMLMCFFALFKQIEEGFVEFLKLIVLGIAYIILGFSKLVRKIKRLFI